MKDKIKNKEYFKKWWKKNKHLHRQRVRNNNFQKRAQLKFKIIEYLGIHPCVDCGNNDIRVLEFDHVRGKKLKEVSVMVSRCWSWERILEEIDKCEVRCANCHRIKTQERRIDKIMQTAAKVKLTGALSVVDRHCDCCTNRFMVNLLDDNGSPMYYCNDCFLNNCSCGGTKVITIEK